MSEKRFFREPALPNSTDNGNLYSPEQLPLYYEVVRTTAEQALQKEENISEQDIEDIVQDVMEKLLEKSTTVTTDVFAWIITVTHRRISKFLEKRELKTRLHGEYLSKQQPVDNDTPTAPSTEKTRLDLENSLDSRVETLLASDKLAPREKQIIELAMQDQKPEQIAKSLNIELNAVNQVFSRIRTKTASSVKKEK